MGATLPWIYLTFAGFKEIGWPVGLKMAQTHGQRVIGVIVALAFMLISGFLLWLAQKHIPIGTSYAVWTGIGAAGTFLYGIMFYDGAVVICIGHRVSSGKLPGLLPELFDFERKWPDAASGASRAGGIFGTQG